MPKNVVMIFVDALSRNNAMTKIPKTMKWLEE
jgi:hypothetical protein